MAFLCRDVSLSGRDLELVYEWKLVSNISTLLSSGQAARKYPTLAM